MAQRRRLGPPSLGIVLAGEDHTASRLVEHAQEAEDAGFRFAFVSDHFHPWNNRQGHSSYLWSVLGAIAAQTKTLRLFSAVTCPILRVHPTTLAHAAATVSNLSNGRFVLGLGTGENLNEHIVGEGWPPYAQRRARLKEAVAILRMLLQGEEVTHQGEFFQVQRARLYDPPKELPIYLAASGPKSARLAQEIADGMIGLGAELGAQFQGPKVTQLSVCWDPDLRRGQALAHQLWPEVALEGSLFTELETPADFEKATGAISQEDVAAAIVCGPEPQEYREAIKECLEAGFEGVALHQIGPNQSGFYRFCQENLAEFL